MSEAAKVCEGCGARLERRRGQRPSRWAAVRFCSTRCANVATRRPLEARFEEKVDRRPGLGPTGECHLWRAAVSEYGYGKFSITRGRWERAHRVAWWLSTGRWPTASVLHRCDTPACVRVDHLFLGTNADNLGDMAAKGRASRGEARHNARLTEEVVRAIRASDDPVAELAQRFAVGLGTIKDVRARRTWAWIPTGGG